MSTTTLDDVVRNFQLSGSAALHAQLAAFLRERILDGTFRSGERLPTLRALSEKTGINYFSVQLATEELRRDGLLLKVTGKGMFVRDFEPRPGLIGVLVVEDPDARGASHFMNALVSFLCAKLAERGYESMVYHDNRLPEKRHTLPPYLDNLIKANRLTALVGAMVPSESHEWFDRLTIPHISELSGPEPLHFQPVRQLLESGRFQHPIFMISGCLEDGYDGTLASFRRCGVDPLAYEICDIGLHVQPNEPYLSAVYRMLKKRFAETPRPDLLTVFPDNAFPAVMAAILEAGIRVPDEMTVATHRNIEFPIFTPFPVTFLDASVDAFAEAMLAPLWGYAPVSRQKSASKKKKE